MPFILILSGSVQGDFRGRRIATLGPGEPLGELSVLDDRARSATARTSEKSTLLMLPARTSTPSWKSMHALLAVWW